MDSTDGLVRGMSVEDLGSSISMPVGEAIKGRLFNVVGDAIDGLPALSKVQVEDQSTVNLQDMRIYLQKLRSCTQVSRLLTL